ncbi:MAG: M28 family peptidase [Planctomycetes bacterium]|nr:M28 family peptidase [Planctomycetota bacterium]
MNRNPFRAGAFAALLLAPAVAQSEAASDITEARIREVLGFLASDELGGRDSPSPGQERAAHFLADGFAKAGLRPKGSAKPGETEPSFFHDYALPGLELVTKGARVALGRGDSRRELAAGEDWRLWDNGRVFTATDEPLVLAAPDADPRAARRAMAGRNLRVFAVAADSPVWLAAAGTRRVLSRRAQGGAPVILLREGVASGEGETLDVTLPAPEAIDVPLKNVVAVLPGSDLAGEFVVVCAHYDHIGIAPRAGAADGINNGADDDATGTTAVLVLAEHFARDQEHGAAKPLRRSLLFACWSAEEKGLRGSRAFADDPTVPLASVAAVVNLEMLGRPEREAPPFAWITGAEYSDFAAIAEPALASRGVVLEPFEMATQLFGASDNLPFAQKGVVAHSISAGTLHRDYHQPGDEPSRIAYAHMTSVVRGIAAVIEAFANRDAKPEWNDEGRRVIERRR